MKINSKKTKTLILNRTEREEKESIICKQPTIGNCNV